MWAKHLLGMLSVMVLMISSAAAYPSLTGYVTDEAGILSAEEESALSKEIEILTANTSIEIVIVTVLTTEGEDRILYASKTGEQNGVGSEEKDDGVVILWSMDNEQGGAIAPGRGIEYVLNDAKVARIGRASREYFDQQQYAQGFVYILGELQRELQIDKAEIPASNQAKEELVSFIVWLIIIIAIIIIDNRLKKKNRKSGFRSASFIGMGLGGFGGGGGGLGGGSGGFGGFGGGSFGGGGGRF